MSQETIVLAGVVAICVIAVGGFTVSGVINKVDKTGRDFVHDTERKLNYKTLWNIFWTDPEVEEHSKQTWGEWLLDWIPELSVEDAYDGWSDLISKEDNR